METVLITGGAGFIGSSCASRLLQENCDVVILDSFETTLYEPASKRRNLDWLRLAGEYDLVEGDVRCPKTLRSIFEDHDIDAVLHFAAVAGVRPSIEKAPYYFDINVTGTSRLMEIARESGVERFYLASSSSVYGGNEKTPFSETDPVEDPISPYAASKRSMELLARTFHNLYGGEVICLRFFTVYGPRQRPGMAIHKFMRILDEGGTIPMFGDGSSGRDYTYISDIVDGVMASMYDRTKGREAPGEQRDGSFRIYNLGGDEVIRLHELISAIGETVGTEPDIEQLPEQPGDVEITNADVTRARQELGYEPQVSLREGLEKMWEWYHSRRK